MYRPYRLDVRVEIGLEPQRAVRAVPELLYMVEQYGAEAAADLRVCLCWGEVPFRGGGVGGCSCGTYIVEQFGVKAAADLRTCMWGGEVPSGGGGGSCGACMVEQFRAEAATTQMHAAQLVKIMERDHAWGGVYTACPTVTPGRFFWTPDPRPYALPHTPPPMQRGKVCPVEVTRPTCAPRHTLTSPCSEARLAPSRWPEASRCSSDHRL